MKPARRIARDLFLIAFAIPLVPMSAWAQNSSDAYVRVTIVAGGRRAKNAIVRADSIFRVTDDSGEVALTLQAGRNRIVGMKLGFAPDSVSIVLRPAMDTSVTMVLSQLPGSLSTIVVTSALTEQRIEDVPIRVEVLSGEDIGEKNSMRPGDLTQMVVEIPGVRVQPLSSAATGAALRVQGFRGQYTQLLADGLPLTGANDAGSSLVQIPPLDLAQVEVVKVGASALYGDAALGGVLNFISRRPPDWGESPVREALLSASSVHEFDAVTFLAAPLSRSWGATLLASAHRSPATDADHDGLADVSQSRRMAIRPRFFWSTRSGSGALLTAGLSRDHRVNGILPDAVSPSGIFFRDSLATTAADAAGYLHLVLADSVIYESRLAVQRPVRDRDYSGTLDRDRSGSAFFQNSATVRRGRAIFVGGIGLRGERSNSLDIIGFNYNFLTTSAFAQLSGPLSEVVSYSMTGRCEHHSRYQAGCVPLLALMARPADAWTIRLSGALGKRAPTPFTEENAITGLSRFRPFSGVGSPRLGLEEASQYALDAGYHAGGLDLNASLYTSSIQHAVGVRDLKSGPYAQELTTAATPTVMSGADFFAVYTGDPVSFTAFYGLLRTREQNLDATSASARREIPLSPSNRAGLDVALDAEEIGARAALEAYYTGVQSLADNPYRRRSRPFTTLEALVSQKIGRALFFVTAENLTNVRQSSYDSILLPAQARSGRWTTDAWAPLSGRMFRFGARFD